MLCTSLTLLPPVTLAYSLLHTLSLSVSSQDEEANEQMEEIQELESQLQVFETVMQRDVAECVTDMETTFQSAEVDLSGRYAPHLRCDIIYHRLLNGACVNYIFR